MNDKFCRIKSTIGYNILKCISVYKKCIFIFFILFLISFITGIMTCSRYSDVITIDNLINEYLLNFLKKDMKFISFFLINSLWCLLFGLFVIFLTRNYFFVICDCVLLCLLSYIFGFDLCVIILSLGLSGVIFGVVIKGILLISLFLLLIFLLSVAVKRFVMFKKLCENQEKGYLAKLYCIILTLCIVLIFLYVLLFSTIHIFVIVD